MRKKPRKTLRETIEANQASLKFMTMLVGNADPTPNFSIQLPPKIARTKATPGIDASESQILKSILAYLKVCPKVAMAGRINSGTFEEDGRFIQLNSFRGMSDIIGILHGGRWLSIEVKSRKGRVMPHQQEFIDKVNASGGLGFIARSVDDVAIMLDLHT